MIRVIFDKEKPLPFLNTDRIPLLEIANVIKKDIEHNLHTGTDIYGNSVAKLKESTRKQKGHNKVFFRTGELYRSVVAFMQNKTTAIITIAKRRYDIARYLGEGTDKMPSRKFFGISKNAITKIEKLIKESFKIG